MTLVIDFLGSVAMAWTGRASVAHHGDIHAR
jgi:hypothetical protein